MISVKDRIPSSGKEGRVKITRDDGTVVEGIMNMADDPSENGTPWNRQTARLMQGDIRTYPAAAGQSIAAGDVVDIVDGEAAKVIQAGETSGTYFQFSILDYCALTPELGVVLNTGYVGTSTSTQYLAFTLFRMADARSPVQILSKQVNSSLYYNSNYGACHSLARIDDTRFLFTYYNSSPQGFYARIGTVSGSTITFGEGIKIADVRGYKHTSSNEIKLIRVSETHILALHRCYSQNYIWAQVLTISGTTVTAGTLTQQPAPGGSITVGDITHLDAQLMPGENSNRVFTAVKCAANDTLYCVIISVASDGTITFGPSQFLGSNINVTYQINCCTDGVNALISFQPTSTTVSVIACSVSGDTISSGAITSVPGIPAVIQYAPLWAVNGDFFLFYNTSSNNAAAPNALPVQINNLVPTFGDPFSCEITWQSTNTSDYLFRIRPIDDSRALVLGSPNNLVTLEYYNGQAAGRWINTAAQAVALTAAEGERDCDVLLEGTAEAAGLAEGTDIASEGIVGYAPREGVVSAMPGWMRRVETGSYVGTGTYGGGNPTTLTFGFNPKLVVIQRKNGSVYNDISLVAGTQVKYMTNSGSYPCYITWGDKNISLYSTNSADYQCNYANSTYYYIAIG